MRPGRSSIRAAAQLFREAARGGRGAQSVQSPDLRALATEVDGLSEANATLTRILGAIEEYVHSGEFLSDGSYVLRFAGHCQERFPRPTDEAAWDAVWVDYVHSDELELFSQAREGAKTSGTLDIQYRLRGADGLARWGATEAGCAGSATVLPRRLGA